MPDAQGLNRGSAQLDEVSLVSIACTQCIVLSLQGKSCKPQRFHKAHTEGLNGTWEDEMRRWARMGEPGG